MSYSTLRPPQKVLDLGFINGNGLWTYSSTADGHSTVAGAGYLTDGLSLGMKVGDLVISVLSSSLAAQVACATLHYVKAVTSTGASLTDIST